MTAAALRAIHDKYMQGDSLTDDELNALYDHFTKLGDVLDAMFLPEYKLVQRDVWAKVDRLRSIKLARSNKS